mmetsp:Transcript_16795/g.46094  ORF Transcript_16795/g.46094 Transcript_16795/m.46094 type:complete len:88 (+) Transcript_16795:3210-3473(+)
MFTMFAADIVGTALRNCVGMDGGAERSDAMRWIGKCSKAECRKDSQKILCIDSLLSKPFNEHGMYHSLILLIAVAIVDDDDDDGDVW